MNKCLRLFTSNNITNKPVQYSFTLLTNRTDIHTTLSKSMIETLIFKR